MDKKFKNFIEVIVKFVRMAAICWYIRTGGECPSCDEGNCEGCHHNKRLGLFEGMDLSGVDLSGIDFKKMLGGGYWTLGILPLDKVNLRGANLCGCDLSMVSLRGADLREAVLCGANLEGVDLRGADLRGANLSPLPRGIDDEDDPTGLVGAHLEGALLCDANLRGAFLEDTHIGGTDFMYADLSGATLKGATGNANFQEAKLGCVSFEGAAIQNSAFDNAELLEVDFDEAKTEGCSFHGAIMEDISFDGASGDIIEASEGMTDAVVVLDRFEDEEEQPLDEIERLQ